MVQHNPTSSRFVENDNASHRHATQAGGHKGYEEESQRGSERTQEKNAENGDDYDFSSRYGRNQARGDGNDHSPSAHPRLAHQAKQ